MVLQLFRTNKALAAKVAITTHRAKGYIEVLQLEKKKRQHSKRLGLTSKEVTGTQWFKVPEILEAKALQA